MKKIKKLTSAVVSLMMICTSMGEFALWSSAEDEYDVKLTLKSSDKLSFSVNDKKQSTYTLNGETKVYEKIMLTGKLEKRFIVENGEHYIVLNDITINDTIRINPNATANIKIEGTNTITATVEKSWLHDLGEAGINVPKGATLNLSGTGTLTAKGSDDVSEKEGGAGIGGRCDEDSGIINISGNVTVNAQGGNEAAAIGGGEGADGGITNISGGIVIATSTSKGCAAGIGGGNYGNGGNITISGGTVKATGGDFAAGIGGGIHGNGGNITISGGTVEATAGEKAEPIGGGAAELYTGTVTIKEKELDKETRKQYYNYGSIKVNPEGKVEQYTER